MHYLLSIKHPLSPLPSSNFPKKSYLSGTYLLVHCHIKYSVTPRYLGEEQNIPKKTSKTNHVTLVQRPQWYTDFNGYEEPLGFLFPIESNKKLIRQKSYRPGVL
jgi:hypothetical protein